MKNIPISVWLAATVLFCYSAYGFWQNPIAWLECLGVVVIAASFVRITYWFIEGE
jgi:hypothetical protein